MAQGPIFQFKDMFYYRKIITITSLGAATLVSLFANRLMGIPVFIFSYLASVSCLDVIVYGIKKCKESDKVSAKILKTKDKMTPKQLDQFITYMVKVRLVTFALGAVGLFSMDLMDWIFITLFTRGIYFIIHVDSKICVYPARYGKWTAQHQSFSRSRPHESPHKIHTQKMDMAFYRSTGIRKFSRH